MNQRNRPDPERQRLVQKYRQQLIKIRSHLIFDRSPTGSMIRWVLHLLIAGVTLVIITIMVGLIHTYHDSAHWTRITGPKTADIPTDILYASADEKADKLKYLKYQGLMWDRDRHVLKSTASAENYRQLEKAYDKLKRKDDVSETNNQIKEAWSFHQDYQALFSKKDHVKMSTTPEEISQLINDHFPKITPYVVDGTQYQFANDAQTKMNNLASDQAVMNQIVANFSKQYTASGTHTLKSRIYATSAAEKKFKALSGRLHYHWALQQRFSQVYSASGSLLQKHDSMMSALLAYREDQSQMNSFNKFLSFWNSEKDKLDNQTVDLPDFTGKSKSDVDHWASENNITVKYKYESSSSQPNNSVLSQMPSASQYDKIIKGSTMTVYLAQNANGASDSHSSQTDSDTLNMNAANPTADRESRKADDSSASSSSDNQQADNDKNNGNDQSAGGNGGADNSTQPSNADN